MDQFEKEGYVREAHLIDIREASKYGCFILFPTLLFYGIPYVLIWQNHFSVDFFLGVSDWNLNPLIYAVILVLVMAVGIALHELIHGLFWALFAKHGWKSIKFGVIKEHLTPYCHCKEPLKVKHYMVGGIMPLIILGIIPGVTSWINGNWLWLLFGFFFTISAIGDIMVINLIRKLDKDTYVQDHPNEAGYYLFKKIEE